MNGLLAKYSGQNKLLDDETVAAKLLDYETVAADGAVTDDVRVLRLLKVTECTAARNSSSALHQ